MKKNILAFLIFACSFLTIQVTVEATTVVGVVVPEGIVIAADSRSTVKIPVQPKQILQGKENNQTIQVYETTYRIASDFTQKLFQINNKVGAVSFGQGVLLKKNINSLIEEFKASTQKIGDKNIDEVAEELVKYFENLYKEQQAKFPNEKMEQLGFYIAGYDKKGKGKLLTFSIPGGEINELHSTDNVGAAWGGQTDVIVRLIKGYSLELARLIENQNQILKKNQAAEINYQQSEYIIGFDNMSTQDAVDFALFLIKVTIETQRFSLGTQNVLGGYQGVGGAIDVAVITPEGFKWIQKKEIKAPF